jgi:hypothetical protein
MTNSSACSKYRERTVFGKNVFLENCRKKVSNRSRESIQFNRFQFLKDSLMFGTGTVQQVQYNYIQYIDRRLSDTEVLFRNKVKAGTERIVLFLFQNTLF